MSEQVAIIVPFYKTELSEYESIALEQCFRVLSKHTIIAIKPKKLVLPSRVTAYPFSEVISFEDKYFAGIGGYNELMMSELFYGRFLKWEYVLIHQLDAFVFKDELEYWCANGGDYIGAPWIRRKKYSTWAKGLYSVILQKLSRRYNLKKHGLPNKYQFDDMTGNGGFSLRRTKIFHELCIRFRKKIEEYNQQPIHQYNEDVFWSIEVNRKQKMLKIPDWKTALKFSVEFHPARALALNNNQLPFGCHAWDLNVEFWRPIFEKYGYVV
jgi:hypothetical protein